MYLFYVLLLNINHNKRDHNFNSLLINGFMEVDDHNVGIILKYYKIIKKQKHF